MTEESVDEYEIYIKILSPDNSIVIKGSKDLPSDYWDTATVIKAMTESTGTYSVVIEGFYDENGEKEKVSMWMSLDNENLIQYINLYVNKSLRIMQKQRFDRILSSGTSDKATNP